MGLLHGLPQLDQLWMSNKLSPFYQFQKPTYWYAFYQTPHWHWSRPQPPIFRWLFSLWIWREPFWSLLPPTYLVHFWLPTWYNGYGIFSARVTSISSLFGPWDFSSFSPWLCFSGIAAINPVVCSTFVPFNINPSQLNSVEFGPTASFSFWLYHLILILICEVHSMYPTDSAAHPVAVFPLLPQWCLYLTEPLPLWGLRLLSNMTSYSGDFLPLGYILAHFSIFTSFPDSVVGIMIHSNLLRTSVLQLHWD